LIAAGKSALNRNDGAKGDFSHGLNTDETRIFLDAYHPPILIDVSPFGVHLIFKKCISSVFNPWLELNLSG
jgi:hypothetical protein